MAAALESGADLSDVDERWHALLLSRCPNPHLLRLIGQTKPLLKRLFLGAMAVLALITMTQPSFG